MSERIINAEVEGTELEALSSLLLVLLPKKDGGMRPVAIANTIVYEWRKHMHSSSVSLR